MFVAIVHHFTQRESAYSGRTNTELGRVEYITGDSLDQLIDGLAVIRINDAEARRRDRRYSDSYEVSGVLRASNVLFDGENEFGGTDAARAEWGGEIPAQAAGPIPSFASIKDLEAAIEHHPRWIAYADRVRREDEAREAHARAEAERTETKKRRQAEVRDRAEWERLNAIYGQGRA